MNPKEALELMKKAMGKKVKGKNAIIKIRLNKYEEEMKGKIITAAASDISYADLLAYLENEIEQSKKMTAFNYQILCFKTDGAYQLHKAIEEIFGVAQGKGKEQPSGGGEGTMQTLDVQLADGTRLKVPYGEIALEGLGEGAKIKIYYDEDLNYLYVNGECQFKFASLIDDIIERTKELLSTESIYANQAIEISELSNPQIMNLNGIDNQLLILSDQTQYALQPLNARLMKPEECLKKNVPLKYGCLLEGPYGTGKTLLAFKLAKKAIGNGWIFVYLKDPTLLARTLKIMSKVDKSGYGVIVFVEDIDQVTRGDRDNAMQDILNTLDGGDTKSTNIISLFTTNHIELIEPTFLRGKRIGSVISLDYLDAKTAEVFIKESFKDSGYIFEKDLSAVCKKVAESNIVPAFMAEIVESVKSNLIIEDTNKVANQALIWAIESYLRQVALSRKKDMSKTPEVRLATSLREVLGVELLTKLTAFNAVETAYQRDSEDQKDHWARVDNILEKGKDFKEELRERYND